MKKRVLDYNIKVRLPVVIFTMLAAFAITFYVSKPEREGIGYNPEQPINFSHKLHAGTMGIDCQYCHNGTDKSRFALVPSTNICMNCHTVARKKQPEIQKLASYFEKGKPIAWKRVHKLAEFTYFNHSVHVNRGIDCENCHGDVKNMDRIEQVQSFSMSSCLNCHRNAHDMLPQIKNINEGPDNCFACHR